MTAQLLDGNALAKTLRRQVAERTLTLKSKGITPGLAVLLVGEDPASQVYVRNKVQACNDAGVYSLLERHPATMTQAALLQRVKQNLDAE